MAGKKPKFIYVDAEDIIAHYDLKYHAQSIWYNKDGVWRTLDDISKEGYKTAFFIALIGEVYEAKLREVPEDERDEYKIPPPRNRIDTGTVIGIVINTCQVNSIFKGIVFKNGYVKADGNGFVKTKKVPFTTVQIAKDYKEDVKPNKVFVKWFKAITGEDKEIQAKYLTMWSYALSSESLGVLMYSYGPGGIGKSEVTEKIANFAGRINSKKIKSTSVFGKQSAQNGRFSLRGINNKSMAYMDEFIKTLAPDAGNTLKGIMNEGGYIEYEDKRSNDSETLNTHSWFSSSNHYPKFQDLDPWVEERVVIAEYKKVSLSQEDLKKFMAGEYIDFLIKMLVKAYTNSAKYKGTRNKLLKIDEYQTSWKLSDALKTPEEIWACENNVELDNKTMNQMLDKYKADTNLRTNSTKMGIALTKSGFEKKRKQNKRFYLFMGDIPTKYKAIN